MPLKLEGKTKPFAPQDKIEFWGIKVPIIRSLEDFPIGARLLARDLILSYDGRSMGQLAVQLFCLATESNLNPDDRIEYTTLRKLNLTPEAQRELEEAVAKCIGPLLEHLASDLKQVFQSIEDSYELLNQVASQAGDEKNVHESTPTPS
ncbi:MAG: hypothetical protein N2045_13885 [Fimbriimonadales bacterium]|nr:hypothetical protein [Fimbriimonadales bacterium]